MAEVLTSGVKAQGNVKISFVETIVDPDSPTLAEINAGEELSCYLMADGWNPAVDEARGNAPARLCTTTQFEQFGTATYSLGDLRYTIQPQDAAAADGVLAWETLSPGTSGYFVERQGLNAVTDSYTAGEFVNVWPVTLGQRVSTGDTTDEFAEFVVTQGCIVTNVVQQRVPIGA